MTENKVKIFAIQFDIPLDFEQVRQWRGAIAEHIGWDDERFHNHRGAKESYFIDAASDMILLRIFKKKLLLFRENS